MSVARWRIVVVVDIKGGLYKKKSGGSGGGKDPESVIKESVTTPSRGRGLSTTDELPRPTDGRPREKEKKEEEGMERVEEGCVHHPLPPDCVVRCGGPVHDLELGVRRRRRRRRGRAAPPLRQINTEKFCVSVRPPRPPIHTYSYSFYSLLTSPLTLFPPFLFISS